MRALSVNEICSLSLHDALPISNVEVFGEWARSFQDLNRLSPLDAEDDAGSAYEAGVRVSPIELWERIEVSGMYRHRRLDRHFSPFDRFRPVEFGRQWNLDESGRASWRVVVDGRGRWGAG